jgi:hypothetical protein
MIPGEWNFTIYQGAALSKTITWPDRDMTGGTFAMHIRKNKDSAEMLLELTTANGRITASLSGSDTLIVLDVSAVATAALDFSTYQAYYDLEYIPASGAEDTERLLMGRVALSREVTR